ncbi:MAG TPA: DUF475 domain-containing protein, partial [Methanomicrobiales archaeon]|nr:DUF475 domain-containing protein [Methanomicrobiales archaeon]
MIRPGSRPAAIRTAACRLSVREAMRCSQNGVLLACHALCSPQRDPRAGRSPLWSDRPCPRGCSPAIKSGGIHSTVAMDIISILLIIAGLCLFETISSIDNAIINAEVLSTMQERYRRWFLVWGLFFAVFVIRGMLPWLIVWMATP